MTEVLTWSAADVVLDRSLDSGGFSGGVTQPGNKAHGSWVPAVRGDNLCEILAMVPLAPWRPALPT